MKTGDRVLPQFLFQGVLSQMKTTTRQFMIIFSFNFTYWRFVCLIDWIEFYAVPAIC